MKSFKQNENEDVKLRTIKSAKWTTGHSVINAVYGPIYKILLATMVNAIGFAYISVFSIILQIGDLLNRMGMSQALLVEKETNNRQFSSVLWIDSIKAFLLCAIIIFTAPLIEAYYSMENLTEMVKLLGICVFFSGISRTFRCYLQKELRLDVLVKIEMLQLLLDTSLSIFLIWYLNDIMGYVYATLIGRMVAAICFGVSAVKQGFRICFCFDYQHVKNMVKFARSVSLRQIFDYVINVTDELLIAKMFSDKSVLGYYYFAKDLVSKPQSVITSAISRIALSLIAKFNDNIEKIKLLFVQMSKYLAFAAFPVFCGIALVADIFLPTLFGKEYVNAVFSVRMFCIGAAISTISLCTSSAVLYALNKPDTILKIDIFVNFVYIILLMSFGRLGVNAIVFITVTRMLMSALLSQIFSRKAIGLKNAEYIKYLSNIIFATVIMAIAVIIIKYTLKHICVDVTVLCFSILTGIITYGSYIWIKERQMIFQLLSNLKSK